MIQRNQPSTDGQTERCETCEGQTAHTVRIELKTESRKRKNAEFSREPYRIATCESCGETRQQRMNNA